MIILKSIFTNFISIFLAIQISALAAILVILLGLILPIYKKKFLSLLMFVLFGFVGGYCAIWSGIFILGQFSIVAGNLFIIILTIAFFSNDVYRIRTRPDLQFEIARMLGDYSGIAMASLLLIWGFELKEIWIQVTVAAVILFLILFIIYLDHVMFWKFVSKHPDKAYQFFNKNDAQYILENKE